VKAGGWVGVYGGNDFWKRVGVMDVDSGNDGRDGLR